MSSERSILPVAEAASQFQLQAGAPVDPGILGFALGSMRIMRLQGTLCEDPGGRRKGTDELGSGREGTVQVGSYRLGAEGWHRGLTTLVATEPKPRPKQDPEDRSRANHRAGIGVEEKRRSWGLFYPVLKNQVGPEEAPRLTGQDLLAPGLISRSFPVTWGTAWQGARSAIARNW